MPDLPNRVDFFAVFADEVLARAASRSTGRQITAAEVFTPGSDVNLIAAGGSAMAEEVMRQTAHMFADHMLDGAQGDALDRWAANRYGSAVPRKPAAPARVPLTIARPTGTFGTVSIPAGTRATTDGGTVFETLTTATLTGSTVGPVSVNARAVNAGTAGNVAKNTITRFERPLADVTLTVTNLAPATGGDAKETDTAYRSRIRSYPASLVKGTIPAIEFGAKTVPGVRQASGLEEVDSAGNLTGRGFLFVADANGQANLALVADVSTALREYRPIGIQVVVVGGVPVFQTITYHLGFLAGVDQAAAFEAVRAATVARVNQLAPMEPLRRSMLFEIARSVPGVVVAADAVTLPIGDVVPAAGSGDTIRTTVSLVTNA